MNRSKLSLCIPALVLSTLACTVGCSGTEGIAGEDTASSSAAISTAARYALRVDTVLISKTRAWHEDTDVVAASVQSGSDSQAAAPRDIGNVNDGSHSVQLATPYVTVSPGTTGSFLFSVTNSGYDRSSLPTANKALNGIGWVTGEALKKFYPKQKDLWDVLEKLTNGINGIFLANCDGIVAADKLDLSADDLDAMTAATGYWQTTRHYNGTDSAVGCGSNSQYDVVFTILREGGATLPPAPPPSRPPPHPKPSPCGTSVIHCPIE